MPELKAAAERLRERASMAGAKYVMARDERRAAAMCVEAQDDLLAAQALEALAWMKEHGWSLTRDTEHGWNCYSRHTFNDFYAEDPLEVVLAAMTEETKGKDDEHQSE